jgi:GAF domain-containing protein
MDDSPLQPVPATAEVLELLGPGGAEVQSYLSALAERVGSLVDGVVGLSLSLLDRKSSMTFTLAVSDDRLRGLDAAQYVDDGPCVDAVLEDRLVSARVDDPLSEARWSLYARAGARFGVRSSLSVPIHHDGRTVGGLNVYASAADAFADRVGRVAGLVDATADEAVSDADLAFAGRDRAVETLVVVQDSATIDVAAGLLAQRDDLTEEEATTRILVAARRAGIAPVDLAVLVIEAAIDDLA